MVEIARSGTHVGPALVGAVATLAIVYALGQRRGWLDPVSLVLVGVIVSAICGALILMLQHLMPLERRGELLTWMTGHIQESVRGGALLLTGSATAAGAVAAIGLGRAMDAASLGDDEARTVGVSVARLRLVLFALAGALTSLAVALTGPIGFVGLVAPHVARLILGPQHRVLLVGSVLVGITLLVTADVAAQMIDIGGGRMPVGVFTALVGGPAFIWLLRTGRGRP